MATTGDHLFTQAIDAFRAGRLDDAERQFKALLVLQPSHVGALNILGVLLASRRKFSEAEPHLRTALKLNSNSDATYYNYGVVLKGLGRAADALEHFSKALAINPGVAETWNNRGTTYNDLKRYAEAIADFDRAISLLPNNPAAFCNKGKSLEQLKRHDDALGAYEKALALAPNLAEAWFGRGCVFIELKRYDDALAATHRALELNPGLVEALLGRGHVFYELERYEEAVDAYNRALALKPDLEDAWLSLGHTLFALKHHEQASAAYDKALNLNPDLADAWLGQGNVAGERNQYEAALAAFGRALALKPDLASAWIGRGNVYFELKRYADALYAYDEAIAAKSDVAEAWNGRGNVHLKLKLYTQSLAAYERALALKPGMKGLMGAHLHCKMMLCDWSNFEAECAELMSSVRAGSPVTDPFPLLAMASSPADQLQCAKLWVTETYPAVASPSSKHERHTHDRIRLGYLSADLRQGPVAQMLVELLELHDSSRFETIGLSIGPDDGSDLGARISRSFHQFHNIHTKSDAEAAQFIRELEVDVLVKVALHTDGSRLGIMAHRPAPIQVSGLAAWTSGADYIDYVMADPQTLPFDQQLHFSEQIVHVPDSYFSHDSTEQIAAEPPSRADAGLPKNAFVFCSFNRSYKLNPAVFDVWMGLLRRIDGSVLWLAHDNDQATVNLRREAATRGIDPSRLVFASRTPSLAEHLARHRLADLFLDTLPFGAHTTAQDALWAGLPVLTCRGDTFVGRIAASQLHAVGLSDLVTNNLDEYAAAALRLAQNPDELRALRDRLAANRLTRPLFDTKRLCRHFEAAYIEMWQRHSRGEPPKSFAVARL